VDDLKGKKKIVEGDRGKPAKGPPMIKSYFSLGFKYSEWLNSRTYLYWIRLGPFYRDF